MVKSVLGVNHRGYTDWLLQRITAIIMAIYAIGLMGFLVNHPNIAFYEWQGLFTSFWVKVVTILAFLSVMYHAWVGMWTVYTDYVKCTVISLILHVSTALALIAFFFASLLIFWGI